MPKDEQTETRSQILPEKREERLFGERSTVNGERIPLYYSLNEYLRGVFGCRVHKIPIDAGFTCPNRDGTKSLRGCIYCNNHGSGTGAFARGISIAEQVWTAKSFLSRRYGAKKFIAYFQSFSNTYAPIEILKERYEQALNDPDIVGLAVGTRPDCVNKGILELLSSYREKHAVWIEYGLQSAHDRTLELINRGHSVADFLDAVNIAADLGIPVCVHIIIGLPGEGRKQMIETARFLSTLKIQGLKIHLLYVVKGSQMEDLLRKGQYRALEKDEYVEIVCDILELLPPDLIIHRLTGDPRPEELVEPLWANDKAGALNAIRAELKKRGSYQGKRYGIGDFGFRISD
ncbi:MAG: TIGR01212 family radical SAM protein [Pseudomonadota bacterium]